MDFQLVGWLIVTAVAIPYVVEILRQVPLLTRVMAILPADLRAGLPRHPHRPALAVFGSARFFLALFRYALRHDPANSTEMTALNREMRASALREAVFGVALLATVIALWRHGWRPF